MKLLEDLQKESEELQDNSKLMEAKIAIAKLLEDLEDVQINKIYMWLQTKTKLLRGNGRVLKDSVGNRILKVMHTHILYTPADIHKSLGGANSPPVITTALTRLVQIGKVSRISRGMYMKLSKDGTI